MTAPINPDNPYFANKAPLQIRRGTLAQLQQYVPAAGELIYSTSTHQVFIGDGVTGGGIAVTSNSDYGTF